MRLITSSLDAFLLPSRAGGIVADRVESQLEFGLCPPVNFNCQSLTSQPPNVIRRKRHSPQDSALRFITNVICPPPSDYCDLYIYDEVLSH